MISDAFALLAADALSQVAARHRIALLQLAPEALPQLVGCEDDEALLATLPLI